MHRANSVSAKRSAGARGFTLVEMLVVIAIIAILAGLAVYSRIANRDKEAMAELNSDLQMAFKEANTRAMAEGRTYCVRVQQSRFRWCITNCGGSSPYRSPWKYARNGAYFKYFAWGGDIGVGARPTLRSMTGRTQNIYFYGDGTMDSRTGTTQPDGITFYLAHENDKDLQYRVAVLPLNSQIRKFVSWD